MLTWSACFSPPGIRTEAADLASPRSLKNHPSLLEQSSCIDVSLLPIGAEFSRQLPIGANQKGKLPIGANQKGQLPIGTDQKAQLPKKRMTVGEVF